MTATTLKELTQSVSRVTWLWRNWLPFGFVTLLVGESGIGKSSMALWLARSIVRRQAWPDGSARPKKIRPVVWCDTEASQAMLAQRVREWRLPATRILLPTADPLHSINLSLEDDRKSLMAVVKEHKPALIVIDSLAAGHSGDENSTRDTTNVLKFLAELARDSRASILAVHHLRKRGMNDSTNITLDRIRGSSTLSYFARSVLAMTRCGDDLRLEIIKSNLTQKPNPLAVVIAESGLSFSPVDPILGGTRILKPIDVAENFLRQELASGPRGIKSLRGKASKSGIAQATLYRAKKQIGVVAKGGRWVLR